MLRGKCTVAGKGSLERGSYCEYILLMMAVRDGNLIKMVYETKRFTSRNNIV